MSYDYLEWGYATVSADMIQNNKARKVREAQQYFQDTMSKTAPLKERQVGAHPYIDPSDIPNLNLTLKTSKQTFYHVPPEIIQKEPRKLTESENERLKQLNDELKVEKLRAVEKLEARREVLQEVMEIIGIVKQEKLQELQQCYTKGENTCAIHNRSLAECVRELRTSGQVN